MNSTVRIIVSIAIILLIAGLVGWLWFAANDDEDRNDTQSTTPTTSPTQLQQQSSPSGSEDDEDLGLGIVKEIEVTNEGMDFIPSTITVNRGDVVRIIYTSVGDVHTFTLPEFDVDTGDVADGEQATVEFVAAEPGSFEFYCTPHRDAGMTGTLIVE